MNQFMTEEELKDRARIIANATLQPWYSLYQQDVLQRREEIIHRLKMSKKEDSIWKLSGMLSGFDACASIFEEFRSISAGTSNNNEMEAEDASL